MRVLHWLALSLLLLLAACQQAIEPRIETSSEQLFYESVSLVRSQVKAEHLALFDQTIEQMQKHYQQQQELSLLPAPHPLQGLTAEEVLRLANQQPATAPKTSSFKLRSWMTL